MGEMKVPPQERRPVEPAANKPAETVRRPTPADMLRELRKANQDPLRRLRS